MSIVVRSLFCSGKLQDSAAKISAWSHLIVVEEKWADWWQQRCCNCSVLFDSLSCRMNALYHAWRPWNLTRIVWYSAVCQSDVLWLLSLDLGQHWATTQGTTRKNKSTRSSFNLFLKKSWCLETFVPANPLINAQPLANANQLTNAYTLASTPIGEHITMEKHTIYKCTPTDDHTHTLVNTHPLTNTNPLANAHPLVNANALMEAHSLGNATHW